MESEEHQHHNQSANGRGEMFPDDPSSIESNQNENTQDQQHSNSLSVKTDLKTTSMPEEQTRSVFPAKVMIIKDNDSIHEIPVKSPEEEDPYTYVAIIGECSCKFYCA